MNLVYSGLSAQTVTDMVMGLSGIISAVFLVSILFFGIYGLYGVLRLKKEQYLIPHRLMYPNYHNGDDCRDPVEYMDFIQPRLTILSVVMILSGLVLLTSFFFSSIRTVGVMLLAYGAPFVAYLWYSVCLKQALKKYW